MQVSIKVTLEGRSNAISYVTPFNPSCKYVIKVPETDIIDNFGCQWFSIEFSSIIESH